MRCRVCGFWSVRKFETREDAAKWGDEMMRNQHPPKSGWMLGYREPFPRPQVVEVKECPHL